MAKTAEGDVSVLDDREHALRLFRQMALVRRFEERTEEQYTRARIGGYCHLAIGEEASSVGAIDALADGDALFASYRDHGTALAVGSPAAAVMAELFGKDTGVAHGRGGSMHLLDVERRFFGGWGIVGAHLPIAAGAALALESTATSPTPFCASSATARSTPARSTRRSTWPPLWKLPIVFQVDQQPVRDGHVGRAVLRRARALASAPPPTACTASGSMETTCWPCARPPDACWRRPATSASPRCSRR